MYYLLLMIATVLFSIQFVFNKVYQREAGETFVGSCRFLMISSLVFGALMFAYNGFRLSFEPFSLLMAACALISAWAAAISALWRCPYPIWRNTRCI